MPFVISLMSVGDGYRDVTGADGDSGLRCYTGGGGRGVGLRGLMLLFLLVLLLLVAAVMMVLMMLFGSASFYFHVVRKMAQILSNFNTE